MGLGEAVLRGLLYSFTSPFVFLPALAIGWFARAWWQAVAGSVLLAATLFAISQTMLPEGAKTIWWLTPVGLVPPLAYAVAAHYLRGRLGVSHESAGARLGLRLISAVIGLAIGTGAGAVIGFFAGSAYVQWAEVSNFEGAAGYMVFLVFVFPGALIGAGLGAVLAWRFAARRWAAKPEA